MWRGLVKQVSRKKLSKEHTMATIQEKIKLLEKEIDTLHERIAALKQEATDNMTESERMQEELEPIPFNTFT